MATRYITGASNAAVKAVANEYEIGLLLTPDTAELRKTKSAYGPAGMPGGYAIRKHMNAFPFIALDNAGYGAKGEEFIYSKWLPWIVAMSLELTDEEKGRTLWATLPDKLDWFEKLDDDGNPALVATGKRKGEPEMYCVGDALATLELANAWAKFVRWLGFRPALVAGDGMEHLIDEIPWDDIDAVFLGGSTDWKLGEGAAMVTKEAKARGKAVHMGRVSSGKRMAIANRFGCDTADGTYLANGPVVNLPNVLEWIDKVNDRDPLPCYALVKARAEKTKAELKAKKLAKVATETTRKAA